MNAINIQDELPDITYTKLRDAIDHTALKPETSEADLLNLFYEANTWQIPTVCFSPNKFPLSEKLASAASGLRLAVVVGFPSGAHTTSVKVQESREAITNGADEIDLVIDLAAASAKDWKYLETQIASVRREMPAEKNLKVIIESALFETKDIRTLALVCEAGGADYVKTSTGFHPSGGASLKAVQTIAEAVGGRLGIKASGGIKTLRQALSYLDAGATRLGMSASLSVLSSGRQVLS